MSINNYFHVLPLRFIVIYVYVIILTSRLYGLPSSAVDTAYDLYQKKFKALGDIERLLQPVEKKIAPIRKELQRQQAHIQKLKTQFQEQSDNHKIEFDALDATYRLARHFHMQSLERLEFSKSNGSKELMAARQAQLDKAIAEEKAAYHKLSKEKRYIDSIRQTSQSGLKNEQKKIDSFNAKIDRLSKPFEKTKAQYVEQKTKSKKAQTVYQHLKQQYDKEQNFFMKLQKRQQYEEHNLQIVSKALIQMKDQSDIIMSEIESTEQSIRQLEQRKQYAISNVNRYSALAALSSNRSKADTYIRKMNSHAEEVKKISLELSKDYKRLVDKLRQSESLLTKIAEGEARIDRQFISRYSQAIQREQFFLNSLTSQTEIHQKLLRLPAVIQQTQYNLTIIQRTIDALHKLLETNEKDPELRQRLSKTQVQETQMQNNLSTFKDKQTGLQKKYDLYQKAIDLMIASSH